MILHQINAKIIGVFSLPIFSSLLHCQSIIPPSSDISHYAILFTNSITNQRLPTDFEAAHLSEVCDSDFSEYRQVCLSILGKEWLHGYYNGN